jgi:hypothetical protein
MEILVFGFLAILFKKEIGNFFNWLGEQVKG